MKRSLSLALLLALALTAAAQKSTATVTLAGAPAGARLMVAEAQGGRLVPTDTLTADKKGRFRLERYSHQPETVMLCLDVERSPVVHLMLLPSEKITLGLHYRSDINALDVESVQGSDNMRLYQRFSNLNTRAQQARQPQRVADSLAPMLEAQPALLMSALLVTFYEQAFDQYAPLYRKIRDAQNPAYSQHELVKHLDSRLKTVLLPGTEAPEIALPSPSGDTLRLSDLRGKVVLIDFWASWCGPCRRENPNVVALYRRYHDKGFEIFSVSLDQNGDAWRKAIKDDGLLWPYHVSDLLSWNSTAGRRYGINSIPATVLVDRQGRILARNLRGEELGNTLEKLFAQ